MSYDEYRCMIESEDTKDEGPANCQYPKCWINNCPHHQARERLSKALTFLNACTISDEKQDMYIVVMSLRDYRTLHGILAGDE